MQRRRCAAMLDHRGCNDDAAHNGLIRATKSQSSRRNVLDVYADAVPAQRVRRVDRRDGHLDQAHDRQEGDGEPGVYVSRRDRGTGDFVMSCRSGSPRRSRSNRSRSCRAASSGVGIRPSRIMALASPTAVEASMCSPWIASQWARHRPEASCTHQARRLGDHSTQAHNSLLMVNW